MYCFFSFVRRVCCCVVSRPLSPSKREKSPHSLSHQHARGKNKEEEQRNHVTGVSDERGGPFLTASSSLHARPSVKQAEARNSSRVIVSSCFWFMMHARIFFVARGVTIFRHGN